MRATAVAVLACLVAAAPAGAVVGGQPVAPETVPWFATITGCGGVLVAPDRVATAGHCIAHRSMKELEYVDVGGTLHRTARAAIHPGWRHENGDNLLDDVAIIQLDSPAAGIAPVTLGGAGVPQAAILGRGRSTAPGSGAKETFDLELRGATLRLMTDASCARAWSHHKGNGGESFDAARMVCAIDADGLAPLSSGCNGDSGGSPTWAPLTAQPAKVTGTRAVGAKLTCRTSGFTGRPTKLEYVWQRQGGRKVVNVSHARTYTVRKADAGHPLVCGVTASNDGGILSVPFATSAIAKIPR